MQLPGQIIIAVILSNHTSVLLNYIPESSLPLVTSLLQSEPVTITITKPRKTKFGDYRFPTNGSKHKISINCNLNKYAFLITLIHEMAHLKAFKNYGRNIKPHGNEWQQCFINLAEPFLNKAIFPEDLKSVFIKTLNKGVASSCTDLDLFRALKEYDLQTSQLCTVESLEELAYFAIGKNKIFKKGPKSRKRYRCLNLQNGKEYMVHPLAEVQEIQQPKLFNQLD